MEFLTVKKNILYAAFYDWFEEYVTALNIFNSITPMRIYNSILICLMCTLLFLNILILIIINFSI